MAWRPEGRNYIDGSHGAASPAPRRPGWMQQPGLWLIA